MLCSHGTGNARHLVIVIAAAMRHHFCRHFGHQHLSHCCHMVLPSPPPLLLSPVVVGIVPSSSHACGGVQHGSLWVFVPYGCYEDTDEQV